MIDEVIIRPLRAGMPALETFITVWAGYDRIIPSSDGT